MIASHFYIAQNGFDPELPEFEIAYAIASAVFWKRFNGDIYLACDTAVKNLFSKFNILKYYDRIIDLPDVHRLYDDGINLRMFWSAAKILTVQKLTQEGQIGATLDIDCVCFQRLNDNNNAVLMGLHWDNPFQYYYTSNEMYRAFGLLNLDLSTAPVNFGILVWRDSTLMLKWCERALKFARDYSLFARENKDLYDNTPMGECVFFEQRLIPALAKAYGQRVDVFENLPFGKPQRFLNNEVFSHLCGEKREMRWKPYLAKQKIDFICNKLLEINENNIVEHIKNLCNIK